MNPSPAAPIDSREGPVRRAGIAQMRALVGEEVGVSPWVLVDQAMIDAYANLTGDRFFIHVDPERARREAPHGGTIAHGFLTMSLLPHMTYQVCPFVEGTTSMLNYGMNRLRFVAPVPTGSRVRGRFTLASFEVEDGKRWRATWNVSVELEGRDKPALVAEWLSLGFL